MTDNFVFRGRFYLKLDTKGRLLLPPLFRKSSELVITTNRYGPFICLDILPLKNWKALEQKFLKQKKLDLKTQFYLSGGVISELDSQNRLLISSHLRQYAKLKEKVLLVGVGEKFEIWSESEWNQYSNSLFENFHDNLSDLVLKD